MTSALPSKQQDAHKAIRHCSKMTEPTTRRRGTRTTTTIKDAPSSIDCSAETIPKRRRHPCVQKIKKTTPCVVLVTILAMILVYSNHQRTPTSSDGSNMNGSRSLQRVKQDPAVVVTSRRFPAYGTPEFDGQCNWIQPKISDKDCTILVRPHPQYPEGISAWVAQVAEGFILAVQAQCRLLVDYSANVSLQDVMEPIYDVLYNWTLPTDFDECHREDHCFLPGIVPLYQMDQQLSAKRNTTSVHLVEIPKYRFSNNLKRNKVDASGFEGLEARLPGFRYESGMACALASLFQIKVPTASTISIASRILPALQDENALVIGLYLRTGHTDQLAKTEQEGNQSENVDDNIERFLKTGGFVEKAANCTKMVEQQHIRSREKSYSNVVWMVTTDSPTLGRHVVSTFHGSSVRNHDNFNLQRTVLTTASRGLQTRPARGPTTADFQEAFWDWYLLGESDAIVTTRPFSFGFTASLRTATPSYLFNQNCMANAIDRGIVVKEMQ